MSVWNQRLAKLKITCQKCALVMLVASLGFLAACSSKNSDDPTTYPVTGLVTLEGRPVEEALVVFRPKTIGKATIVQATTDDEGTFDAYIFLDQGKRTKRGMMPADYQIEVTQMVNAPGQTSIVTPPKNLLPQKYASVQTSGLATTVSVTGKNELFLELSKE